MAEITPVISSATDVVVNKTKTPWQSVSLGINLLYISLSIMDGARIGNW